MSTITEFIGQEGPEDADWIKTLRWDLPTNLRDLMPVLTADPALKAQKQALSKLMALDAWQAAPPRIKQQATTFLAGSQPVV